MPADLTPLSRRSGGGAGGGGHRSTKPTDCHECTKPTWSAGIRARLPVRLSRRAPTASASPTLSTGSAGALVIRVCAGPTVGERSSISEGAGKDHLSQPTLLPYVVTVFISGLYQFVATHHTRFARDRGRLARSRKLGSRGRSGIVSASIRRTGPARAPALPVRCAECSALPLAHRQGGQGCPRTWLPSSAAAGEGADTPHANRERLPLQRRHAPVRCRRLFPQRHRQPCWVPHHLAGAQGQGALQLALALHPRPTTVGVAEPPRQHAQ